MSGRFEQHGNAVKLPPGFPEALRKWRLHRKLSAQAVAVRTGVSEETYQKLEGGRKARCFRATLEAIAKAFDLDDPAELLRDPVLRVVGGEPVEAIIRRVLLDPAQDAVEYVAYCTVGPRGRVTVTAETHEKRLTGLIGRYKLGVTVAELEAGWGEYAARLPAQVEQLSGEGRALGQGGLVRLVLDFAKGGVFWSVIVDGTFLVVATIDQTAMESGRAHTLVTRLEKVVRDHALVGG